jgi:hypothetical protein
MQAENTFRRWVVAGRRVECSLSVINAMASAARDGFRRFRHGGMEVGGILIGSKEGSTIRVSQAKPAEISYGRGAIFLLTATEQEEWDALIRKINRELAPRNLQVVGYYESRTRREASLKGSDMEIYDAHFYQPSQVCIIVKADNDGEAVAAVYIRNERGEMLEASLEGDLDAVEIKPAAEPPTQISIPEPPTEPMQPIVTPVHQSPRRVVRPWAFAIPVAALGALAGMLWVTGFSPLGSDPPPPPPVTAPHPPPSAWALSSTDGIRKPVGNSKRAKHSRRGTRARRQAR